MNYINTHHFVKASFFAPRRRRTLYTALVSTLLFLAATAAQGQTYDYVFYYTAGGTNYFLARNGTSGVQRVNTFSASTCVWTASKVLETITGSNYGTAKAYLSQDVSGTTYYMCGGGNNTAITLNTTATNTNYTMFGLVNDVLCSYYGDNNGSYRSVYYTGTRWQTSTNTNQATVTYRAIPILVTHVNNASNTLATSIEGESVVYTTSTALTAGTPTGHYNPPYAHFTIGGNTYYYNEDDLSTLAGEPADIDASSLTWNSYTWTLEGDHASSFTLSGSGSSRTLSHTGALTEDKAVTVRLRMTSTTGLSVEATHTVLFRTATPAAPTLTREECDNTIRIVAPEGSTLRYTTDGTTPTASVGTAVASNIYEYTLTAANTTMKAVAIRGGNTSAVATLTESARCPKPTIVAASAGNYTISVPAGTTVKYTTDGSDPAAGSNYTPAATITLGNGSTLRAIAIADGMDNSCEASVTYVTTGVSGNIVTLNDLEDHTWSYYRSTAPDTDYPDQLRSPDPRNVKITYDGNGGQVSYNETENTFVYYKTLEKVGGAYTYKVIPSPFSKRPTVGTGNTRWRGFGGWEIVSGGEYISGHNNGDVLDLEETLTLTGLDAGYMPNCISATIELQATWVQAYVSTVNATSNSAINSRPSGLDGSTYETNFIVILDNRTHAVSNIGNVTVSCRYPDGSAGGNGTVNGCISAAGGTKVEFANISGTFTAAAGPLIVGRGCTGTVGEVTGTNATRIKDVRLESGTYSFVHPMQNIGQDDANRGNFVFGCDYDRAQVTNSQPYGDNTRLRIVVFTSTDANAGFGGHADNSTDDLLNITIKSGYYGFTSDFTSWQTNKNDGWGLGIGGNTDNFSDDYVVPDETGTMRTYTYGTKPPRNTMSFYVGPTRGGGKGGRNTLRIEGGELTSVNGGGTTTPDEFIRFDFRMTGGWVKGAIYGGASATDCHGSSRIVITGGEVNSWIGGGCNGTDIDAGAGATNGTIYIYAGGDAQIRSHNSDGVYNNAWGLVNHIEGGQIYGGGRGMGAPGSYSGSATRAFVVVADDSYVEQNVYGGSCHGVSQNGYVYILGGTVGKKVFGGSFQPTSTNATWQAKNTHVRMYGGTMKGGVYGGNDESGTVTENAEVLVLGGTVGAEDQLLGDGSRDLDLGNVFGGGYGVGTSVQGNVVVVIGDSTARTPHVENPIVWGNVFGGGHEANYTSTGKTFKVLGYNGTVKQSVYGGGKGVLGEEKGKITGDTHLLLKGSIWVSGNVYGGGLAGEVTGKTDVRVTD